MSTNTNNTPLVSIITVNYNQTKVTCDLLESLKKNSYSNFEIILIDNGSVDNAESTFKKIIPDIKYHYNENNLGFAGGNNLGIKMAKGDYMFFVNNDTEIPNGTIENLLKPFDKTENLGVVSPKIFYYDEPTMIQYAGYTPINPYTARNSTIGQYETDNGQYDQTRPTPYAHGAAMMVSRKVINEVGPMPEFFFLYYEELDWCEQIRRAGFEIYYEPKASIFHKESVSVGRLSSMKTYYLTRNRILFMRRNATSLNMLGFSIFLVIFTIPKNVLLYFLKLDFNHLISFIKGILWNFNHSKSAIDLKKTSVVT